MSEVQACEYLYVLLDLDHTLIDSLSVQRMLLKRDYGFDAPDEYLTNANTDFLISNVIADGEWALLGELYPEVQNVIRVIQMIRHMDQNSKRIRIAVCTHRKGSLVRENTIKMLKRIGLYKLLNGVHFVDSDQYPNKIDFIVNMLGDTQFILIDDKPCGADPINDSRIVLVKSNTNKDHELIDFHSVIQRKDIARTIYNLALCYLAENAYSPWIVSGERIQFTDEEIAEISSRSMDLQNDELSQAICNDISNSEALNSRRFHTAMRENRVNMPKGFKGADPAPMNKRLLPMPPFVGLHQGKAPRTTSQKLETLEEIVSGLIHFHFFSAKDTVFHEVDMPKDIGWHIAIPLYGEPWDTAELKSYIAQQVAKNTIALFSKICDNGINSVTQSPMSMLVRLEGDLPVPKDMLPVSCGFNVKDRDHLCANGYMPLRRLHLSKDGFSDNVILWGSEFVGCSLYVPDLQLQLNGVDKFEYVDYDVSYQDKILNYRGIRFSGEEGSCLFSDTITVIYLHYLYNKKNRYVWLSVKGNMFPIK